MCYLKNKNLDLTEDLHKSLKIYLKDQKRNSKLNRKIRTNQIDIIFQIIIYDSNKDYNDYIDISIRNADSSKILSSGKLATYKKRNLQFLENNIENTINEFIIDFLNRYFLTSIEIVDLDINEDYNVIRNGTVLKDDKSNYFEDKSNNSIIVYDVPKYINSFIQLESNKRISKKYYLENLSKNLLLNEPNRQLNINKKGLKCKCDDKVENLNEDCFLICSNRKSIKLQIRDKFPIARLQIKNNKNGIISGLNPMINLITFKDNNSINGKEINDFYEFQSNFEGKYLSLMNNSNYASPFPFLVEFRDSSIFNDKKISFSNDINLYKKSKPLAHSMNVVLPGSGLFYFEDKTWMSSIHLSSYLSIVVLAANSYNKFLDYRNLYESALVNYNSDSNIYNRNIVEKNYSLAYDSKSDFRNYIGLALVVNVLSNYYLDKIFKGKIKW